MCVRESGEASSGASERDVGRNEVGKGNWNGIFYTADNSF